MPTTIVEKFDNKYNFFSFRKIKKPFFDRNSVTCLLSVTTFQKFRYFCSYDTQL